MKKKRLIKNIDKLRGILTIATEVLEAIDKEIGTKEADIVKSTMSKNRSRGLKGGRRGPTADQLDQLRRYVNAKDKYGQELYSVPDICGFMRISRNTYYRWLRFLKSVEDQN